MNEPMMRLGSWSVERTLGRDLSGAYHAARHEDGRRATLYVPSGELAHAGGEALFRLLALHRDVTHASLSCFRSVEHDDGDVFLIGDAEDDALDTLRSGRRPVPGQTRPVGAALAAALVAAHDSGLIHGGLELDNVLWAPHLAPRILGTGVAALGSADRATLAQGDILGLGRLLCAVVASWTPRGPGGMTTEDDDTVRLVRMLAEPGAVRSMREAHALLAGSDHAAAPRIAVDLAAATRVVRRAGSQAPEPRDRAGSDADRTLDHAPEGLVTDAPTDVHPTDVAGLDRSGADELPTDAAITEVSGSDVAAVRQPGSDLGSYLGRYRILSRLGCGGMGEVFLAEDPALRRGVAIKRIRPGLERDRTFRARLRREAQLAARLSHRAIVQVFDLITHDDVDHMVMEYVPGPSLHTLLAGRPMAVAEAVRITAELADGLAYAHQQGVVHRDLKLENILISIDGQPKIADFGIARRAAAIGDSPVRESVTGDGLVIGTSRAMSPEQILGRDVDARSDLFSFGVLLYELVTGASPFATSSDAATLLRVLHERHTPAATRVPAVPRALSELIDRLLEKDPARRPDRARAVRDRLQQMLDDTARSRRGPYDASAIYPPAAPPIPSTGLAANTGVVAMTAGGPLPRRVGGAEIAAARGTGAHRRAVIAADHELPRRAADGHRIDPDHDTAPPVARDPGIGRQPSTPRTLVSKIQAPFVLAEIRALRSSIFKRSPEVRSALAIADRVEHAYKLDRADLFIPAFETFCAIIEPFAMTVLTGTLRRIGYEIFPQYVSILGIQASNVRAAMDIKDSADLVRLICDAYSKCVVGTDAGVLVPTIAGSLATITDTTFMPCQLQMGVFLGAGQLTGLFNDKALTEKRCRARGDDSCVYELAL
jgi:serine/threonine-protein kinase